jgi:hypothetical protein
MSRTGRFGRSFWKLSRQTRSRPGCSNLVISTEAGASLSSPKGPGATDRRRRAKMPAWHACRSRSPATYRDLPLPNRLATIDARSVARPGGFDHTEA